MKRSIQEKISAKRRTGGFLLCFAFSFRSRHAGKTAVDLCHDLHPELVSLFTAMSSRGMPSTAVQPPNDWNTLTTPSLNHDPDRFSFGSRSQVIKIDDCATFSIRSLTFRLNFGSDIRGRCMWIAPFPFSDAVRRMIMLVLTRLISAAAPCIENSR